MMNISSRLRQMENNETFVNQYYNKYKVNIDPNKRYLALNLQTTETNLSAQALIEVDQWLANMDFDLPGIPWELVPLHYIIGLIKEYTCNFMTQNNLWYITEVSVPEKVPEDKMIQIIAQPYNLLCHDWPDIQDYTQFTKTLNIDSVYFQLHYELGKSQLLFSELKKVALNDLLVIESYDPCLLVNNRRVFKLNYNFAQEVIVESLANEEDLTRSEEGMLFEWDDLAIDIEFILDSPSYQLNDLRNIQVGSVLPVAENAEKSVKIYFNKKLFARGELVALENGRLAIEIQHINSTMMK